VNFPDVILYQKDCNKSGGVEVEPPLFDQRTDAVFPEPMAAMDFSMPDQQSPSPDVQETEGKEKPSGACDEAVESYEEGRYAEAAESLMRLASSQGLQPQMLSLLARALANQGKLSEALYWCDRWIAADKLNPSGYFLRAVVLQEEGAADQAVESLRRALYLEPNFVLAHFALGNLTRNRGNLQDACKHFRNVLRLLRDCRMDDILPESDGITAGRLTEIVNSILNMETAG
jgi:chemotaxis protein methyltransferase CheR